MLLFKRISTKTARRFQITCCLISEIKAAQKCANIVELQKNMLNEYCLAIIGFDTVKSEPSKVLEEMYFEKITTSSDLQPSRSSPQILYVSL